jgi:Sigma-70 region 2.
MRLDYEEHKRLVNKLAWSWARTTGWEFAELQAIANSGFAEAAATYDGRAAESTYVWSCVQNALINEARRRRSEQARRQMVEELPDVPSEGQSWFVDFFHSVGKEAQEVVQLVLTAPTELMEFVAPERERGLTQSALRRYYHERKGWSFWKIDNAFNEIKEGLR